MAKKVYFSSKLTINYSVFIPVFTFALTKMGQTKDTARGTLAVLCLLRGMMKGMNTNIFSSSLTFCSASRFVQIGVASFGSILTCAASPGGFSRLNYDVLQWIRNAKVNFIKL